MTVRAFDIERRSFEIIDGEAGNHGFNKLEWAIVRRIIHSTADFDFCSSGRVLFHRDAINSAFEAFRNRRPIFTDVEMVLSALNKKSLGDLGISAFCNISNPKAVSLAKETGMTRSEAAMQLASSEIGGGIVAVGNAPTALLKIVDMIETAAANPILVVGLPVGFVAAAESKEALTKMTNHQIPYITNIGRKGGSAACASIINALMLLYKNSS